MKKKLSYLIILTLIVIMPISIKALTGSINITCDKEDYSMNETATCKVTGTSDEEVRSISAKINSEYLNVSFTADSIWQGNGDNGNIQLYSDSAKKETFNIGTLKVTVKDSDSTEVSGILTLSDVKYSDVSIEGLQTQISFTNSSNTDDNFDGNDSSNNSGNNSNGTSSGSNTGSLSNTSSTSNNPQTSDFKVGLIVCLIVMALIISVLGYKKLKKLLRN